MRKRTYVIFASVITILLLLGIVSAFNYFHRREPEMRKFSFTL